MYMEELTQMKEKRYEKLQKILTAPLSWLRTEPSQLELILGTCIILFFASPSKSRIRNLQSIGRGLRLKDNNSNATLYDVADDLTYNDNENYTLAHFRERINIYSEEDFDYEIHNIELNNAENNR